MRSVSANGQKTSLKLESGSGIARAAAEVSLAGADPRDFADSGTLQKDARMEWKKMCGVFIQRHLFTYRASAPLESVLTCRCPG